MLKEFAEKIRTMAENQTHFDPMVFDDPLASKTAWTPAKSGGANFGTHQLVSVGSSRLEFHVSVAAYVFYAIFLLVGLGVMVGVTVANMRSGQPMLRSDFIVPVLIGLLFFVVGGVMLRVGTKPIVFDKTRGMFWKGRVAPDQVFDRSQIKDYAELENIHAIQLLSERCRGKDTSYYSYELNLVLENGERINVVDHGNKSKFLEDASTLAAFLEKPLWNAI